MHAPFYGIDVIDKAVHGFTVARLVLHGDINNDFVFFSLKGNDFLIDYIFSFIQEFDKFGNPTGIGKYFLSFGTVTDIGQCNGKPFVQKRQLTHADFQNIKFKIYAFFKYFRIGLKCNGCSRFLRFSVSTHMFGHNAPFQFHFMEPAFSLNDNLGPFRQSIYDRYTYTVETAGNRIAFSAEFTACMKHGQYNFHGRFPRFVHACGDTAAVIDDRTASVII